MNRGFEQLCVQQQPR